MNKMYLLYTTEEYASIYNYFFTEKEMLEFALKEAKEDSYCKELTFTGVTTFKYKEEKRIGPVDKDGKILYTLFKYKEVILPGNSVEISAGDINILLKAEGTIEVNDGANSLILLYNDYATKTILDIITEFGELIGGTN